MDGAGLCTWIPRVPQGNKAVIRRWPAETHRVDMSKDKSKQILRSVVVDPALVYITLGPCTSRNEMHVTSFLRVVSCDSEP
jgi:hypothetical protein